MDEADIFEEIRSVFRVPMYDDNRFEFQILQSSGGDSRNLVIPELSSSYKWTAAAIAGRNAKAPIYILAVDELMVSIYMSHFVYLKGWEDTSCFRPFHVGWRENVCMKNA